MRFDRMFDDLEGRFEHLEAQDMRAMSDELTRAERAQITLGDRLRAASGQRIDVRLQAGIAVSGTVDEVGADWLSLATAAEGETAVIPMRAITMVEGLAPRARPRASSEGIAPLGLGHVLRRIARDRSMTRIHTESGRVHGRIRAVGADAMDVAVSPTGEGGRVRQASAVVIPFAALLLVAAP